MAGKRELVVALSGGVGGAKLAHGLSRIVPPHNLLLIANTGDDFEHLGLAISPDLDTLMYTLAGLNNPQTGWGIRDETWMFMAALERLGGETWFKLGDQDLATHVERTRRLRAGEPLSRITADFCSRLKVAAQIAPMTDDKVRTRLRTSDGWLDFQDYFVRRRCEPVIKDIVFEGAATAKPHPQFLSSLRDHRLRAVIICPSNPFISIDPILALPGVRQAFSDCAAPVVAISPIIGGQAVKGPTAKMMAELGVDVSAAAVARHYGGILDGYVVDRIDREGCSGLGVPIVADDALMLTVADRERLAQTVLAAADALARETVP
jgi:LPPG:FO 2-phospho-L-lactate transferase